MALVNFVTFVVFNILDNPFSMQNFLKVFSGSSSPFSKFSMIYAKKMLLVSHKLIFIENQAVLLCVTTLKRARAFVATV